MIMLGTEYGGLTDVKSINFSLAGSYRLNHQWSFALVWPLSMDARTMKRTGSQILPGQQE